MVIDKKEIEKEKEIVPLDIDDIKIITAYVFNKILNYF